MENMTFHPLPGVCVIEVAEKKAELSFSQKAEKYLKIGTIIATGAEEWSEGTFLPIPCEIGQKWVFLSYNDDVDHRVIDGKEYYFVKYGDLRSQI